MKAWLRVAGVEAAEIWLEQGQAGSASQGISAAAAAKASEAHAMAIMIAENFLARIS
jgi:hypothetical protein